MASAVPIRAYKHSALAAEADACVAVVYKFQDDMKRKVISLSVIAEQFFLKPRVTLNHVSFPVIQ